MTRDVAVDRSVGRLATTICAQMALPKNQAKGDWAHLTPMQLHVKLQEEVAEISHAMLYRGKAAVLEEIGDTGAVLAMLVDVVSNMKDDDVVLPDHKI